VPNFPVDPLRDLVPIAAAAEWVGVMLAKKDLPVSSFQEFIAYAKARPNTLNFGTPATGAWCT
jgi:tripartite-type tricarboxylate transporter receptor subunit TctC